MIAGVVLRDVELDGRRIDLRVESGRIAGVGSDLSAAGHAEVVDCNGGAVLPGLHDHHIHLLALAAALQSVRVGPPDVADRRSFVGVLRAADLRHPAGDWLRAVGYHESVAGPLDRWALDAIVPSRPVRVQHRSAALWVVNSAALRAAGVDDAVAVDGIERDSNAEPTGRLWRLDAWLRRRVPSPPLDLAAAGDLLLRAGVTGVTDATPTEDPAAVEFLAAAVGAGVVPQRVVITGGPRLDPGAAPALERGPVKLLLADHEPPPLDAVLAGIRAARAQDRPVAVHCVTRVSLALTIAALAETGAKPGDRIEHGAVIGLDAADQLASLGVTVVTNPGFVDERGDNYLLDVDEDDLPDLWRCRSLMDRGVAVGAGTDAPFGRPDPWAAIAAASNRRTAGGSLLGEHEALPAARALDLFLSPLEQPGYPPRPVRRGAAADLCVLTSPLAEALTDPGAVEVRAVVIAGTVRYSAR